MTNPIMAPTVPSKVRIGTGAGFSGDRIEPALALVERGELDYLVFECLAERTIALANGAKLKDPNTGYDPLLEIRMRAVLPLCDAKGVRIITNMGAANPISAAKKVRTLANSLGLSHLKIVAISGDDVLDLFLNDHFPLPDCLNKNILISANAYIGTDAVVEALNADADIIIAGRIADPSMFLAPLMHEFNWK